jgi:diacylglycerol kinase family enzyme
MTAPKHITFIVNPAAGRGKTKHLAPKLEKLLSSSPYAHSIVETTRPREATDLARIASNTVKLSSQLEETVQ